MEPGRGPRWKRHDIPVHVEIDVLENVVFTVLVKLHLVSRSSSSCGSERAGHSTASSRSPGFCRCATRVFRSTLLWRQLEAWQVGSALHAIRRQGGPKYHRRQVQSWYACREVKEANEHCIASVSAKMSN
ncbi:hypothetical protein ANTPLA_LOCUS2559 [Anthophora plagiata]